MAWGEVRVYDKTVCMQLNDHVKVFKRNGAARGQSKSADDTLAGVAQCTNGHWFDS